MLTIKKYCPICKTTKILTYDGNGPRKNVNTYYFTCEKGHHCEVFVTKRQLELIEKDQA